MKKNVTEQLKDLSNIAEEKEYYDAKEIIDSFINNSISNDFKKSFKCFVDFEDLDASYNDCVFDEGNNINDCTFAMDLNDKGKGKNDCQHWRKES